MRAFRLAARFRLALALFALLAPASAAARLKVVATLPTLGAVAREVGGELVSVEVMSSSRQDPHYVDPRPDLVLKLNGAELLLHNGLELEVGWLPSVLRSSRNPRISNGAAGNFDASTLPRLLEIPAGKLDRSAGDIHPGGNPHYLYDPRAVAAVARGVGERLALLDAANEGAYRQRALALAAKLEALATEQRAKVDALPAAKRSVVTYHRSYVYLLDWLALPVTAEVEPKPGISPDPAHVARVLQAMRAQGTRVILAEEYYPTSTTRTLVQLTGGKLVQLPGGVRFEEGQGVVDFFRAISEEVLRAIAG